MWHPKDTTSMQYVWLCIILTAIIVAIAIAFGG